ncbi:MAG: hypothetical protein WBD19_15080, partial [Candidatus Acidiferrum sp.]
MNLRAYLSRRVVTTGGVRPAALLVEDSRIRDVVSTGEIPAEIPREDFGDAVLLPGLVDSHVHINDPGRA